MILAFLDDPFLRTVVRRAALPDEDVFWAPDDILEAARRGFPRLAVSAEADSHPLGEPGEVAAGIPLLRIGDATLRSWRDAHRMVGFAVRRVDDHGRRLRSLMARAARPTDWVNATFRDLSSGAGRPLPPPFRGMGRRVLEFPSRYRDLRSLARLSGITRGALKARFRRRDLPSPYTYLRWFRVLSSVHLLKDEELTTEEAAHRVGLHSSGNFCRYVVDVSGFAPSELRTWVPRMRILTRFVEECLGPTQVEGWAALDELFLEKAA